MQINRIFLFKQTLNLVKNELKAKNVHKILKDIRKNDERQKDILRYILFKMEKKS